MKHEEEYTPLYVIIISGIFIILVGIFFAWGIQKLLIYGGTYSERYVSEKVEKYKQIEKICGEGNVSRIPYTSSVECKDYSLVK